jgi:hypothetical protein
MSNFRKTYIIDILSSAVRDNPDLEIMDIVRAALRGKNYKNQTGVYITATDEEFSMALETTIEQLNNERN